MKMNRFVIRTDAGGKVGFGHAVRCLSLAEYLRTQHGIPTVFYSNPYAELQNKYESGEFEYVVNDGLSEIEFLHRIGEEARGSLVFIDKMFPYSRDEIRSVGERLKLIMFHNECEGMYECDYAIFPSMLLDDELIHDPRWSEGRAELLHGADYIIINEAVSGWVSQLNPAGTLPHMAITTGASDPEGVLIRAVDWINESEIEIPVRALAGFDLRHRAELKFLFPRLKPSIEIREFNYTDLLSSRLAITTFGVVAYELVYANVPIITIGHIEKNALAGEKMQKRYECSRHLGLFRDLTKEQMLSAIQMLWNSDEALSKMRANQRGLIDGKGLQRLGGIISSFFEPN